MNPIQTLQTRRPRVYLAGPSVFRPNAKEHLASLAAQCERHGLTPLLPTDDCAGAADASLARRIYDSNTQMLRSADGVLADLQEWRGHEPDSGTAFEVGFAAALDLPIACPRPGRASVMRWGCCASATAAWRSRISGCR